VKRHLSDPGWHVNEATLSGTRQLGDRSTPGSESEVSSWHAQEADARLVLTSCPSPGRESEKARRRDFQIRRRWVVLVDGEPHQIRRVRTEARQRELGQHITIVADLIHGLEYLWRAA